MKTNKNPTSIHYQQIVLEDDQGSFNLFLFSGNLDLLKSWLDSHKDVIELVGDTKKAKLNKHGQEVMKDIKLEETILYCDDISQYIEG